MANRRVSFQQETVKINEDQGKYSILLRYITGDGVESRIVLEGVRGEGKY